MSTIDWGEVDAQREILEASDNLVFKQKDIPMDGSVEVRFLPPWEGSGTYFKSRTMFWINKKPYMSLASVGLDCPLMEEYKAAQKSTDPEIKALLDHKDFNVQTDVLYPFLLIDAAYDNNGEPTSIKVNGNMGRVLSCTKGTSAKIQKIICDPKQRRAGKGMSVMHRELGRNVTIDKTQDKNFVAYTAKADPSAMDLSSKDFDAFYADIPNLDRFLRDQVKDAAYLRGVIRNYLYGDELVAEPEATKEDAKGTKSTKKAPKAKGGILGDVDGLKDE
tara:strand:+ start:43 stop:870 length:828 start_codon:yes stop_codon:yes gene_type:complete